MGKPWCILDDMFPNVLSAFRVAEYNAYLAASDSLTIFSNHLRLPQFKAVYAGLYPQFADRVQPVSAARLQEQRFAYMVFLNNANMYLNALQHFRIPFAFTLYPGGGFGLNEPESDAKLLRVTGSELLQGVLTTQTVSEDYLAAKAPHVTREFIFGGVIHPAYFTEEHQQKVAQRMRYGRDKPIVDICFVAEKYMPSGANKGWPIFAAAIGELLARVPHLRVHIIGGFGPEDYPASAQPGRLIFHGRMVTEDLRRMLLMMDAIISPNEPFKLHPGNFDGFPTGCCIEASLCGAAMIVTDALRLNPIYRDGVNIAFIEPDVRSLLDRVVALANSPDELAALGEAGRLTTHAALNPDVQVGRRKAFLSKAAAGVGVGLGLDV